jgi:hypothetical protein
MQNQRFTYVKAIQSILPNNMDKNKQCIYLKTPHDTPQCKNKSDKENKHTIKTIVQQPNSPLNICPREAIVLFSK